MSTQDYGHWDISRVGKFNSTEWTGFIYEIVNKETGQFYLGKKQFFFKRKRTKSNPSRTKDSDWREYTSSSEAIKYLIDQQGKNAFEFRILQLCSGKCELSFEEERWQFERDVLRRKLPSGAYSSYNKNISHKRYAGLEKQTAESERKRQLLMEQQNVTGTRDS